MNYERCEYAEKPVSQLLNADRGYIPSYSLPVSAPYIFPWLGTFSDWLAAIIPCLATEAAVRTRLGR